MSHISVILVTQLVTFVSWSMHMHAVNVAGSMLSIIMLLKTQLSNSHSALVDFQPVFHDERHLIEETKTDKYSC